jgi:hypothetical protein
MAPNFYLLWWETSRSKSIRDLKACKVPQLDLKMLEMIQNGKELKFYVCRVICAQMRNK